MGRGRSWTTTYSIYTCHRGRYCTASARCAVSIRCAKPPCGAPRSATGQVTATRAPARRSRTGRCGPRQLEPAVIRLAVCEALRSGHVQLAHRRAQQAVAGIVAPGRTCGGVASAASRLRLRRSLGRIGGAARVQLVCYLRTSHKDTGSWQLASSRPTRRARTGRFRAAGGRDLVLKRLAQRLLSSSVQTADNSSRNSAGRCTELTPAPLQEKPSSLFCPRQSSSPSLAKLTVPSKSRAAGRRAETRG